MAGVSLERQALEEGYLDGYNGRPEEVRDRHYDKWAGKDPVAGTAYTAGLVEGSRKRKHDDHWFTRKR
jgi:hypothetical protein